MCVGTDAVSPNWFLSGVFLQKCLRPTEQRKPRIASRGKAPKSEREQRERERSPDYPTPPGAPPPDNSRLSIQTKHVLFLLHSHDAHRIPQRRNLENFGVLRRQVRPEETSVAAPYDPNL